MSLAQGVASLGKGGGRNFVEEEKRVTTRSRKKEEEVESSEVKDEILVAGAEKSLGEVEEGGGSLDGGTEEVSQVTACQGGKKDSGLMTDCIVDSKGGKQVTLFGILKGETPRDQLTSQARDDATLAHLRKLAKERLRGYSWDENLLFKHQLDDLGRNTIQLLGYQIRLLVLPLCCQLCNQSSDHYPFYHLDKQSPDSLLQHLRPKIHRLPQLHLSS